MTGATAGIGRDFALQLAGAGFNVFLASRTTSKLEEIAAEISSLPLSLLSELTTLDVKRPSILRRRQCVTLLTMRERPRRTTSSSERFSLN